MNKDQELLLEIASRLDGTIYTPLARQIELIANRLKLESDYQESVLILPPKYQFQAATAITPKTVKSEIFYRLTPAKFSQIEMELIKALEVGGSIAADLLTKIGQLIIGAVAGVLVDAAEFIINLIVPKIRLELESRVTANENNLQRVNNIFSSILDTIRSLATCEEAKDNSKKLSKTTLDWINKQLDIAQSLSPQAYNLISAGNIKSIITKTVSLPLTVVDAISNALYELINAESSGYSSVYLSIYNSSVSLKTAFKGLPLCDDDKPESSPDELPPFEEPTFPDEPTETPLPTSPLPLPLPPSPLPEPDDAECKRLIDVLDKLTKLKCEPDLTEVIEWIQQVARLVDAGRTEAQQNARRNDTLLREALAAIYDGRTEGQQNSRRNDTLLRQIIQLIQNIDENNDESSFRLIDIIILLAIAIVGVIAGGLYAAITAGVAAITAQFGGVLAAVAGGFATTQATLAGISAQLGVLNSTAQFIRVTTATTGQTVNRILKSLTVPIFGKIRSYDVKGKLVDTDVGLDGVDVDVDLFQAATTTSGKKEDITPGDPKKDKPRTPTIEAKQVQFAPRDIAYQGVGLKGIWDLLLSMVQLLQDIQSDVKGEFPDEGKTGDLEIDEIELDNYECEGGIAQIDRSKPKFKVKVLKSIRDFQFEVLNRIINVENKLCEYPVILPDEHYFKPEYDAPQLLLEHVALDERGRQIDKFVMVIPYYIGKEAPEEPPLGEYMRGGLQAIQQIDGGWIKGASCNTDEECRRVLKILLKVVEPKKILPLHPPQIKPVDSDPIFSEEEILAMNPDIDKDYLEGLKLKKAKFKVQKVVPYRSMYYPYGMASHVNTKKLGENLFRRKGVYYYQVPKGTKPPQIGTNETLDDIKVVGGKTIRDFYDSI